MIINQITAGGGTTPEPYPLLSRVTDDSNNEIGTVCGYHTDANNQKYAVVCLDAQYRLASGEYSAQKFLFNNLPAYASAFDAYDARETATFNCDKILAGSASSGVSHCRAQTFTIAGISYAGQMPTLMELLKILEYRQEINNADTSATANPGLVIPVDTAMWSSTQVDATSGRLVWTSGSGAGTGSKDYVYFIAPVLEIPIP